MYDVDVTAGQVVVSLNGDMLMTLTGGHALVIGGTYTNLQRHDAQRADDFMHGVLAGVNHVAMTGILPAVVLPAKGGVPWRR